MNTASQLAMDMAFWIVGERGDNVIKRWNEGKKLKAMEKQNLLKLLQKGATSYILTNPLRSIMLY
jgi:hypothetical protein